MKLWRRHSRTQEEVPKKMKPLLDAYRKACDYPGQLDEQRVEESLREYLAALGVQRKVERLRPGWNVFAIPSLLRYANQVIDEFAKKNSRTVQGEQAVQDALDVRAGRQAQAAQALQDAQDALAVQHAHSTRAGRDAQEARDAQGELAAHDALFEWDALDAQVVRDAEEARDAEDARDAIEARDAQAARDARNVLDARNAIEARETLAAQVAQAAQYEQDARVAQNTLYKLYAQDEQAARDARDARDGQATQAARDALQRFTAWCIHRCSWWWYSDISWQATAYLGAVQLQTEKSLPWAKPLFDAFVAGAWILHWTEDTLFWAAKPTVHVETVGGRRQLHNERGAALESDIENLYFWHGVLVPDFVVVAPERITAEMALKEDNAEVRRVMIERMGMEKFLEQAGATKIHSHERGDLFSIELPGDPEGCLRAVRVTDASSGRVYFLRVPPTISRADDAVAWTFGFDLADEYRPVAET
jgi:hypothetical protein